MLGRRSLVAAAALGAAALVVGGALWRSNGGPPAYASMRQAAVQQVPGTLEYVLEPPPADFRPRLGPGQAAATVRGIDADEATVVLAMVRDTLRGGEPLGPAWVVIARGVCVRSAKGELVSDARGDDPNDLGCDRRSMLIVAVDPDTGERLRYVSAYDSSRTWEPAVGTATG